MSERDFEGRTALVTGGAKGIGRACCELLAERGAKVAISYLSSQQAAEKTADVIEKSGGEVHLVQADVSSPEEVEAMVIAVTEKLGPIDLLVNNSGLFDYVSHEETSLELWQRTIDVNLTGTYLTTWAVKESMIHRGFGRIVNIASIAALRPRPMSIAYAVSKAGVVAFTQSLAEALAGHNVRVNGIAPGLIDTEILDCVETEQLDEIVQATPLQRMGTPRDIAELVGFLLSERSGFITGQTMVASGGRVMLP